jgi:hypothetical protein
MTPDEFNEAIKVGKPVKYFTAGTENLATARQHIAVDEDGENILTDSALAANVIGNAAWRAYKDGKGVTVQRRNNKGTDYLFLPT